MLISPLRYPGGKAKLYDFVVEVIKSNNLYKSVYCEPYAGGAGLAIKLLSSGFVNKVSLNDIDCNIFAFWQSVLYETDVFCNLIENCNVDIDEWHRQAGVWRNASYHDQMTVGFATFFLNRTNRSGIIEGAGPIGGYKQDGTWKIDARFNKAALIQNIQSIGRLRNQIEFYNIDAAQYIPEMLDRLDTFMYVDPPYYVKGRKLYKNFYNHADHCLIRSILASYKNCRWIASYDDVDQIRFIYQDFVPIDYRLKYSAGSKGVGSEVMYFSNSLKRPDVRRLRNLAA